MRSVHLLMYSKGFIIVLNKLFKWNSFFFFIIIPEVLGFFSSHILNFLKCENVIN